MRVHERGIPEAQLGFFAFAAHHVGGFRLKTFDLTGPSALETLLGTGMCLHLRHYSIFNIQKNGSFRKMEGKGKE